MARNGQTQLRFALVRLRPLDPLGGRQRLTELRTIDEADHVVNRLVRIGSAQVQSAVLPLQARLPGVWDVGPCRAGAEDRASGSRRRD